jgi:poly [ADP-ribose] polymerase 2/3/4
MSKKHILQGFEALKRLSDVINEPQGTLATELGGFDEACDTLSGHYYS